MRSSVGTVMERVRMPKAMQVLVVEELESRLERRPEEKSSEGHRQYVQSLAVEEGLSCHPWVPDAEAHYHGHRADEPAAFGCA